MKSAHAFAALLAGFSTILASGPALADAAPSKKDSAQVKQSASVAPPVAEKRDYEYTYHGITIADPYHWLRDSSYPVIDDKDILDHLKAENAYFEAQMAPHEGLVETIFQEIKGRVKEDDSSVPQKDGDWVYWEETEEGAQYSKHYRRPVAGGEAQLLLDENQLAEGHEYFRLGAFSISKDGRYLAYSTDTDGSERYTGVVKDLGSGELLPDRIEGINGGLTWLANDTMLAYGRANEQWRVEHVRLHRLGSDNAAALEIFTEPGRPGFTVSKWLSAQEDWLIISTGNHDTNEIRIVRADDPTGEQILVRASQPKIEYTLDVRGDTLFIRANDTHDNFRLATAKLSEPGKWSTLIEGSDEFYLTDFDLFKDFYVTEGRIDGLDQVQVRSYADPADFKAISFPEASYSTGLSDNPEYDVDKLRLSYDSMVTPSSVYDYHLADGRLELLKQREIPSGYDQSQYVTERLLIPARDGTMVPATLMMRKDRDAINGGPGGPLHVEAYGSYGNAFPPYFSGARLSLVDRGVAYVIAHVRGGDDLGKRWHDQGKLNARTNTFNDVIDVAEGLAERGYTRAGRISASGGSAGGTLMGVIANQRPDLFRAIVADVPFVDVLNTMLDDTLPLTPGEFPEWGNPIASKQAFAYILSYSPYDQVIAQDYPAMLVTAGLNDPRVTYWEPAKWVAKLRELKTDDNTLLFKINMGAGHGGKSGRYEAWRETGQQYAFLLWQHGLAK